MNKKQLKKFVMDKMSEIHDELKKQGIRSAGYFICTDEKEIKFETSTLWGGIQVVMDFLSFANICMRKRLGEISLNKKID